MTTAARILAQATIAVMARPPIGHNGQRFDTMGLEEARQSAADLALQYAALLLAWRKAAPGICAGHIQLAGEPALPPKPQPPAITEES